MYRLLRLFYKSQSKLTPLRWASIWYRGKPECRSIYTVLNVPRFSVKQSEKRGTFCTLNPRQPFLSSDSTFQNSLN